MDYRHGYSRDGYCGARGDGVESVSQWRGCGASSGDSCLSWIAWIFWLGPASPVGCAVDGSYLREDYFYSEQLAVLSVDESRQRHLSPLYQSGGFEQEDA